MGDGQKRKSFRGNSDYKAEFTAAVDEMVAKATSDRQARIEAIDVLCEEYTAEVGEMPDSWQLQRLADEILREELTDKRSNKARKEEYSFLSETQMERRVSGLHQERKEGKPPVGEIRNLGRLRNIGTDGVDYRYPVRKKLSISDMLYIDEKTLR